MDILENGGMIGFDGLYKFRFIDLFDELRKFTLNLKRGHRNQELSKCSFIQFYLICRAIDTFRVNFTLDIILVEIVF